MSKSRRQDPSHVTQSRRWRNGRIMLGATLVVVAFAGLGAWRVRARQSTGTLANTGVASETMTVHKSVGCQCCDKWIAQLRKEGIKVDVVEHTDMSPVKTRLGVPSSAVSCHTSTIGGYVIEGHVPLQDITRLLADRPDVVGLAAPGMPAGALGMDGRKESYTVVSFDRAGALKTFAVH